VCTIGAAGLVAAPAATATGSTEAQVRPACGRATPGHARCFALVANGAQSLSAQAGPRGYHPADLLDAYNLNPSKGSGQTIGIVDAFDDPSAEADLAVYRKKFHLPPCTTANGCFHKIDQNGGASYPVADVGWSLEISLDVDMASAICPNCKILLVEALTNSYANLAIAVNRAVASGATVVSNSYGGSEFAFTAYAPSYNHPGIPITVSSGDTAYAAGPQVPAALSTVTAVGGTALKRATNARGWAESVWFHKAKGQGAGSGCSQYIGKPSWQHDTGCAQRTIADVSAVADPATGVSVYDSFGQSGWLVIGGTSASAPIIAGVYALAGNGATINNASRAYKKTAKLFDVTTGKNGSCGGKYLCTAKPGYDAPTGLGTPNGLGAF
jgi:subtilase family serine protease